MEKTETAPRGAVNVKRRRTAFCLSVAAELAVAVCALIGAVMNYGATGMGMLKFYTVDSNLLAMAAMLISAVYRTVCAVRKTAVPSWVYTLKYISVCCLGVTFFTVLFVLAPMYGLKGYYFMFFTRDMLYHHFICPVVAAASFFIFDRPVGKPARSAAVALMPTVVYAAVTICLNLTRTLEGPYPFLRVYEQSVWVSLMWCALILGGAYGIAFLFAKLKSRMKSALY